MICHSGSTLRGKLLSLDNLMMGEGDRMEIFDVQTCSFICLISSTMYIPLSLMRFMLKLDRGRKHQTLLES